MPKLDPSLKGCIEWWGPKRPDGYGVKAGYRRAVRAHRFIWEECFGPLDENLVLHHICDNKICVNPEHLEPLTRSAHNRLHGYEVTHCPAGHEYSEENTYWRNDTKRGWKTRKCRACNREAERRKRHED
jgi:hypothetical protein